MESTQPILSQAERRELALREWLCQAAGVQAVTLHALKHDASTRRYYRVTIRGQSYVVMDAPPPNEHCIPFIKIAKALSELGVHTPSVHEEDLAQGFLLLTDMGDRTYLSQLHSDTAATLYDAALDALTLIQSCRYVDGYHVPPFTADFMWQEWSWFKEWFLDRWLQLDYQPVLPLLEQCYQQLVDCAVAQPQVFMHRDYHSANLMVLKNGQVGVLDFQDAFIGPLTYDLVSLLRDCYIDWPNESVLEWVGAYYHKLNAHTSLTLPDLPEFIRWFDFMGVQRHLKALMTFSRKAVRDHDQRYLAFIPRTLHYLCQVTRAYPELESLHAFLRCTVSQRVNQVLA